MRPSFDADVIVVGSGPAGGVAALRARQHGLSVLVLESSPPAPEGRWFTFDRTRATLAHGGLFTPSPPSALALGVPAALGGGFASNSGFYRWVHDGTLRAWSSLCPASELSAARAWVEERLELDHTAPRDAASRLLASTAERLGLSPVDVPFWLHERFDPRGPFLAAAVDAGAVVHTGSEVLSITFAPHPVVHLADGSSRSARVVFLAAGAFGSFRIAAASGLAAPTATAAGHVMMKSTLFPDSPPDPAPRGVIGRVQVSHTQDLLSGCSLAEPWSLLSNHPEHRDRILRASASPAPPVSWYTQLCLPGVLTLKLRRSLRISQSFDPSGPGLHRLAAAHEDLLRAAGLEWVFAGTPSLPSSAGEMLRAPRLSMVHITSTLPLGSALGPFGSFESHPSVACCDVASLPSAPGVNPQAVVLALAKRNVDGILASSFGGSR